MSHTYLIDLYALIQKRMEETTEEMNVLAEESSDVEFQQGRLDTLCEFKRFLAENYSNKLPRRIRGKYSFSELF